MNRPKIAEEIMNARLITLGPHHNVLEGIRLLLKSHISGAPVVDENSNYIGMFSEKCCMSLLSKAARLATETGKSERIRRLRACDVMQTKLVFLHPDMDVFEAIGFLLKNRISGAPVIDENGDFVGGFSEKTCMDVLIESAYSQLPTTRLGYFMDVDRGRTISEHTDLLTIARIFLETPYRRLVVLRDDKVLGQISRRDVLAREISVSEDVWDEAAQSNGTPVELTDTVLLSGSDMRKRPPRISEYMDLNAKTIDERCDFLSIAQLFRETPYRRLPVLRDGLLVGQVSRRDLLLSTHGMMEVVAPTESSLPYFSLVTPKNESRFAT